MEELNKITVYIVEDYHLIRKSLTLVIEKSNDIECIGDFETAESFLEEFEKHPSDIVVMDLGLPEMNGLAATKIIKEKHPETKVIILTSREHPDEMIASLALGANAYCLKEMDALALQNIIREVHKGVIWIHPKLSEATKSFAPKPKSTDFGNLYGQLKSETNLTEREHEVLEKIVEGKTNTEIAQEMCISVHTVKSHVGSILEKLSVTDRVKAAVKAVRVNLI